MSLSQALNQFAQNLGRYPWRQHECLIQHRNMQREEAEKPKRLLYRMKRYRSLLVCDQALLTREKLENDQSSNAEPLSGKPYGLPVGEGSGYAATDP